MKRYKVIIRKILRYLIILCLHSLNLFSQSLSLEKNDFSCGIESVTFVFNKLGVKITPNDIERFKKYSNMKENNMYELYKEIKRKKLYVKGIKIGLEELLSIEEMAICYLWNNHFVVIEPSLHKNKVKIYDPLSKKVEETEIKHFKNIYSGFCLVVSKEKIDIPKKENLFPDVRFEDYIYNFGEVEEGRKIFFNFTFTNVGKRPLKILNIRSTCGCIVINIKKKEIFF